MSNALLKGTFANLAGVEYGTGGGGGVSYQSFTINNATNTIPSNTTVVRLISAIGDVQMAGTPSIAAGSVNGQRLITIVGDASTGSISFAITIGGGIQPICSPTRLQHYGSYEESMEWVWVDGAWKTVSQPAQNPLTGPIEGSFVSGTIGNAQINTSGLALQSVDVQIDPGDATLSVLGSRIDIQLTTTNLVFSATPTLAAPSWGSGPPTVDQQLMLLRNAPNSGYTVTLQDDNLVSGTNLFLASPKCVLRENQWIQLIYTNGEWHEISRSSRGDTPVWLSLTPINSWANIGGAAPAKYYVEANGTAHVRFALDSGTTSTVAFVLPAEARPPYLYATTGAGSGADDLVRVIFATNGNVTLVGMNAYDPGSGVILEVAFSTVI